MSGSQNSAYNNALLSVYQDPRRVFNLADIAMIDGKAGFLNQKLHYWVKTGKILNPRRGIYAKPGFSQEELACKLYRPSYLSLEYVLQKAGVIFQYDSRITLVGALSRKLKTSGVVLEYRKIKGAILLQTTGLVMDNAVSMASPERAFLDMLYLEPDFYFDNTHILNKEQIEDMLPLYQSKALEKRARRLLADGQQ
ncbi:MAG: hypothetical protein LBL44_01195 [Treponema sp.]|jgi:hypothetical protein|nr:hypothetical protein [Treponema sp.]